MAFQRAIHCQKLLRQLLAHRLRPIAAFDAGVPLEEIDDRQAARLAEGDRAGLENEPPLYAMRVGDFPDEAGLANAGVPNDGNHLPAARLGTRERPGEGRKLTLPSNESGEPSRSGGLESSRARARADHLVDFDGLLQPLHRHEAQRPHLEKSLHETQRVHRKSDSARRGELLHSRGQVRRLAHGGVIHAQIAADGADHDLTRIQSDADLHFDAVCTSHVLGVASYRSLHVEGSVAGPHRVVVVGQWRSEERHYPAPRQLVDRTLVAMDRLHHVIENRVEELVSLLGVAVREQLHRTLHVGEEDRDLLALALKCGPRRQDALRQMLGGIGNGGWASVRGRVGELPAARPAETLPRGNLGPAVRTGPGEPCAALLAEPRCPGVRSLAPWTPHGDAPEEWGLACFGSWGDWYRPGWGTSALASSSSGPPEWAAVRARHYEAAHCENPASFLSGEKRKSSMPSIRLAPPSGKTVTLQVLAEGSMYRDHHIDVAASKFWSTGKRQQTERDSILRLRPASGLGRSITLKQVVQVPDIVNDQMYFDREPARVRVVEAGYRSQLSVPLIKHNEAIGAFLHPTPSRLSAVTALACILLPPCGDIEYRKVFCCIRSRRLMMWWTAPAPGDESP